jgi:hypothetical protein
MRSEKRKGGRRQCPSDAGTNSAPSPQPTYPS